MPQRLGAGRVQRLNQRHALPFPLPQLMTFPVGDRSIHLEPHQHKAALHVELDVIARQLLPAVVLHKALRDEFSQHGLLLVKGNAGLRLHPLHIARSF